MKLTHRRAKKKSNIDHIQQLLLTLLLVGFLIFNYNYFQRKGEQFHQLRASTTGISSLRGTVPRKQTWIDEHAKAFNEGGVATAVTTNHLVMVAGHSVTISGHLEDADQDELDWYLLDYQKSKGMPQAIVGHIKAGIDVAMKDKNSLLVFSGGETRASTGPDTEGASYFRVADAMDLWPDNSDLRARSATEEFARDSFENLMFSICRFYEVTKRYPTKITVVSFTFKERRFKELHAKALQWPIEQFNYVGLDPPTSTGFNLEEATKGEIDNAAKPFETDPYGCHSDILIEKRKQRNPFARTPPYILSCPDMKSLLEYCGPDIIEPNKVPWSTKAS